MASKSKRILYVDDDNALAALAKVRLEKLGFEVEVAPTVAIGMRRLQTSFFDAAVVDQTLPDGSGLDLIRACTQKLAGLVVVMVTGTGNEMIAVEAMKMGVKDYLVKDMQGGFLNLLPVVLFSAFEQQRVQNDKRRLEEELWSNEAKFRALVSNIPGVVYSARPEEIRKMTYLSPGFTTLTDYSVEEFAGRTARPFAEVIHPDDQEKVHWAVYHALWERGSFKIEYRVVARNGDAHWVKDCGRIVANAIGDPVSIDGVITDVTDKKSEEDRLELIRFCYDHMPDSVMWHNADATLFDVNEAACKQLGYSREELLNLKVFDFDPRMDPETWERYWRSAQRRSRNLFETELRKKDGSMLPVEVTAYHFMFKGEEHSCSFARDISNRKRAKMEIEAAKDDLSLWTRVADVFLSAKYEDTYKGVLDVLLEEFQSSLGVFGFIDEDGSLVAASFTKEVWQECRMPDKKMRFPRETWGNSIWAKSLRTQESILFNGAGQVPEGHLPIERVMSVPIVFQNEVIGVFVLANKTSDYSEKELEALKRVARYISPALHSRISRDREEVKREIVEREMRASARKLGERVKEMTCLRDVTELLQDADLSENEILQKIVDVIPTGFQFSEITEARILLGERAYATLNYLETEWKLALPIVIGGARAGSLEVCYRERRRAESQGPFLQEEVELAEAIADCIGMMIARNRADAEASELNRRIEFILGASRTGLDVIDSEFNMVYVDPGWMASYGPFAGKKCYEYFHKRDNPCSECVFIQAMFSKNVRVAESVMDREGNRPVQITAIPFKDENGEWLYAGVYMDISERKKIEAELAQSHRLEAVGQLAAGIAHEINTPTQYVGDNARFLQDAFSQLSELLNKFEALVESAKQGDVSVEEVAKLEKQLSESDWDYLSAEIPRAIEQSLEGVARVSTIVKAMKEFSHPMNEEKREIDVGRLLENAITISRNEWKYVAEVELEVDPFLPPVRCRPGEINQVFLNLIVNAAQAIAEKYDRSEEKQGKILVRAVGMNDFVEVRIEDNGTGIPESIRHRVFDPFFTTKEVGKGTGQGLSLVHSIVVKKHGGEVDLETKPGEGTTFIVRLPIVPAEEAASLADEHAPLSEETSPK